MDRVLEVRDLHVQYSRRRGILQSSSVNRAVDGVTFGVGKGESYGLVGESGSGKSTTARAVLGLEPIASGHVTIEGLDIRAAKGSSLRRMRARTQLVFQDPYSSLDPSMKIGESLAEPIRIHRSLSRRERDEMVVDALRAVGLDESHQARYPQEFSGGQRQRICIARAMVLDPSLVVLDEPVSALDVSTQGQVLNLLKDLQEQHETSYLLIAHDLSVVRNVTDRMAVMYLGKIVEEGPSERVSLEPTHPYTAALMSSIPEPNPQRQRSRQRMLIAGDMPSPWQPPPGCRFHTRCPLAMDICKEQEPEATASVGGGYSKCHLHTEGPVLKGASVLPFAHAELARGA